MKKIIFIIAGLLCLFVSCSDGGSEAPETPTPTPHPEETASITLDANALIFDAKGGEKSFTFSTNKDWTLNVAATTSGSSWCTPSTTSGTKGNATVKFTAIENADYDDRSVSVTIKAGTASKSFTVTQKSLEGLLVTANKYEVAQEGGSIEVEVKSNINYQLEISESAKTWISEAKSRALTTKKHVFSIALNDETDKREGKIYIKSGDKVETINVYQAGGPIILLSKNEYTVSDAGETISVDINSNVEFGVQLPEVDWITDVATARGMSSHTLQYTILSNETYDSRSAEIIFYDKNSSLKDTLKIVQAQKDAIVISNSEYTISGDGGTLDFEVSSNVDFNIEISDDWIKQAVTSRGLVNKQLHFTIDENADESVREGSITFIYGDLRQIVKVKQNAKGIPYLTFTAEKVQSLTMSIAVPTLEYSLDGEDWFELGNKSVLFGSGLGVLRLRGKNLYGTSIGFNNNNAVIKWGSTIPVKCNGDIRTLIDYENYETCETGLAKFVGLFSNSPLTSAPMLPATTLANKCYENMFMGCYNLTSAPTLPATTLAESCYRGMFDNCKNLTSAPMLPATTLAEKCYENMFKECYDLTTAPKLPATTLAGYCYSGMFRNCFNLTTAPELPATNLAEYCYASMFECCFDLTTAPELPATNLAEYCYTSMFAYSYLTTAPELPATNLAEYCYASMFWECLNLINAPTLPATTLANNCYYGMFYNCSSLTSAPELPAMTLAESCYTGMFAGCENLTSAPELPAENLANNCYDQMFRNCINLKKSPILPATELKDGCYWSMFKDCHKLEEVTMLASTNQNNYFHNWLYGVSKTGTFIKAKVMTELPIGSSGIPEGWTIVNYE